jgi:UDP-N-acetylmuramyl pentapeptide synthase
MDRARNIAVLDLTHGGRIISERLAKIGKNVIGVDVYNTLSKEKIGSLKKTGINIVREPVSVKDFDLIIAPVHLDPNYEMLKKASVRDIPILSHHQAVGRILEGSLEDRTVVEITGTKAKTSTSILLAEMLSQVNLKKLTGVPTESEHREKKVVSHTSRGLEYWDPGGPKIIKRGLSTTPGSILEVVEASHNLDPEVYIFEVSLGGTGLADVGIITSLAWEYRIAKNTRLAGEAKYQMIANAKMGSILVINTNALRLLGRAKEKGLNVIPFSENSIKFQKDKTNILYQDIRTREGRLLGGGRISFKPRPEYDPASYMTSMLGAAIAALSLDIRPGIIQQALAGFSGIEGRMKKIAWKKRILIDNSSSGMDIPSAEAAIAFSPSSKIVLVIGEEAKQVCEGLKVPEVRRLVDENLSKLQGLILVGDRARSIGACLDMKNIRYAENLSKGLEMAKTITQEGDVILSCVKCFR